MILFFGNEPLLPFLLEKWALTFFILSQKERKQSTVNLRWQAGLVKVLTKSDINSISVWSDWTWYLSAGETHFPLGGGWLWRLSSQTSHMFLSRRMMFLRIGPSRNFWNCTLCSQQSCFNILTIELKNTERSYLLIQNPFHLIGHHGMWSRVIGEILAASTHVPNRVHQTRALKSNSTERCFETKKVLWSIKCRKCCLWWPSWGPTMPIKVFEKFHNKVPPFFV